MIKVCIVLQVMNDKGVPVRGELQCVSIKDSREEKITQSMLVRSC